MPSTKKCGKCRETKPISDFNIDKSQKDGLGWCCKSCRITPRRKANLYYKYRISLRQYEKLFERQKGCCAICRKHQSEFNYPLCIDHNHITGKVRGLLCKKCNTNLGIVENWGSTHPVQQYLKDK